MIQELKKIKNVHLEEMWGDENKGGRGCVRWGWGGTGGGRVKNAKTRKKKGVTSRAQNSIQNIRETQETGLP